MPSVLCKKQRFALRSLSSLFKRDQMFMARGIFEMKWLTLKRGMSWFIFAKRHHREGHLGEYLENWGTCGK